MISSPHPFTAPHQCYGRVPIPAWKGVGLKFNPKSCTPGKNASLSLYLSKEKFDKSEADYSFWGSPGDPSYFRPLYLTGTTELFYRFSSDAGSTKPPLQLVPLVGKVSIDEAGMYKHLPEPAAAGDHDESL